MLMGGGRVEGPGIEGPWTMEHWPMERGLHGRRDVPSTVLQGAVSGVGAG